MSEGLVKLESVDGVALGEVKGCYVPHYTGEDGLLVAVVLEGFKPDEKSSIEQELSDYRLLVDIYKKADSKFELAIRRYVVQKDMTSGVLNRFLSYLDETE